LNANGTPAANLDIDGFLLGTGNAVTLSGDFTDANGFFHVTLLGTYRVEFKPPRPPASTSLFTAVEPITVLGTTSVGVVLAPGFTVLAILRGPGGNAVAGCDAEAILPRRASTSSRPATTRTGSG
jgi:hypothetical protein